MVPVAVADQKVGSPAFLTDRVLILSHPLKNIQEFIKAYFLVRCRFI